MKKNRWFSVAVAFAAALVIACGGGAGDPRPPPEEPPLPPPTVPEDQAWTAPFDLATDARIQALAPGITDPAVIFGFSDDPEAEPERPYSPVAPEGAPMLSIETVRGPGEQISIRVETGILIPVEDGPDFVNIPGTNPEPGPEEGGLWRHFTGYNPSWGPGLGLSAELINFRIGDTVRFVGELLEIGDQGGWPTDAPEAEEWGAPNVPPGLGWSGPWWPAASSPRLVITIGVVAVHGEHDRLLPNNVVWSQNSVGPFDRTITLTQAHLDAIARAHVDLADEEETVPSIRLGLAGLNMAMRVDNIVFTPVEGPPAETPGDEETPGGDETPTAHDELGIAHVGEDDTVVTIAAIIAEGSREFATVDEAGNLIASVEAWSTDDAYILLEFVDPSVLSDFFRFSVSWDTGIDENEWEEWTGPYFAFEFLYDLDTGAEPAARGSDWMAGPANTTVTNLDLRENTAPVVGMRIFGSQADGFAFAKVTLYDMTLEWREPPVGVTVDIDGVPMPGLLVVGELYGGNLLPVDDDIHITLDTPVAMAVGFSVDVTWGGGPLVWAWFAVGLHFSCGGLVSLAFWFDNEPSLSSFTFDYTHHEDDWSDTFESVTGNLVGITFNGFGTADPAPHITAFSVSTGP